MKSASRIPTTFRDTYIKAGKIKRYANPRFDAMHNALVSLDYDAELPQYLRSVSSDVTGLNTATANTLPLMARVPTGVCTQPFTDPGGSGGSEEYSLCTVKDFDVNDAAAYFLSNTSFTYNGQTHQPFSRWTSYAVIDEAHSFDVVNTAPMPLLFTVYLEVGSCAVTSAGTFTGADFGYPAPGTPYANDEEISNGYLKSLPNSRSYIIPAAKLHDKDGGRITNLGAGLPDAGARLMYTPGKKHIDFKVDIVDMLEKLAAEETGAALDMQTLSGTWSATPASVTPPAYHNAAGEGISIVYMCKPLNEEVREYKGSSGFADDVRDMITISHYGVVSKRAVSCEVALHNYMIRKNVLLTDPTEVVDENKKELFLNDYTTAPA